MALAWQHGNQSGININKLRQRGGSVAYGVMALSASIMATLVCME
jgi:hypothetical protein